MMSDKGERVSGPIELDAANPRHRALKRLILGRRDIEAALAAITYLIREVKTDQDAMFEALNCAAVICYSRPFVAARKHPSLPEKYSKLSGEKLQKLHTDLIGLRNKFVAHRDETENKVWIIPKGSEVTWANGKGRGTVISPGHYTHSRRLTLPSFGLFKALCELQMTRLEQHITQEKAVLFP
jgi:hypothetical protein